MIIAVDGPTASGKGTIARALADFGVAPENAAMVGDRHFDIEGAKANRVRAIGETGLDFFRTADDQPFPSDAVICVDDVEKVRMPSRFGIGKPKFLHIAQTVAPRDFQKLLHRPGFAVGRTQQMRRAEFVSGKITFKLKIPYLHAVRSFLPR